LGHPCKFQRVSRLGSVTARHSSSERQPNFATLNRGRHLYSAGGPSRWALAHISSSIFFFPRLISAVADWMSAILPHMVWPCANLECRSETCCTRLAENTARKKSPKSRHLGTIPQLCWAISSQLRHVSIIDSPTRPHNMVNFGPLAAETDPVVWGTPANFNGFRVLAALLPGTRVLSVSHTLRR